jgi:hypothetical protein
MIKICVLFLRFWQTQQNLQVCCAHLFLLAPTSHSQDTHPKLRFCEPSTPLLPDSLSPGGNCFWLGILCDRQSNGLFKAVDEYIFWMMKLTRLARDIGQACHAIQTRRIKPLANGLDLFMHGLTGLHISCLHAGPLI